MIVEIIMAKYRIGQKVKVKLDLIPESRVGCILVNPAMMKYCGKKYTISNVLVHNKSIVYHFKEIPWNWEENMLCTELFKNFVNLVNHV